VDGPEGTDEHDGTERLGLEQEDSFGIIVADADLGADEQDSTGAELALDAGGLTAQAADLLGN
jgi:hypothetical protein